MKPFSVAHQVNGQFIRIDVYPVHTSGDGSLVISDHKSQIVTFNLYQLPTLLSTLQAVAEELNQPEAEVTPI